MINDITWLDRYFVSAFTFDANGVGHLDATETGTTGDTSCTILGKYGSQTTPDDDVVEVPLPWAVSAGELWSIVAVVTAKSADCSIRRRITIDAIVWGDGATATLDDAPEVGEKGTGNATATLTVDGSSMILELSPVDADPLTWGFEIRGQKL